MDLRMIKTRRDIRNALLDLLDDNRSFESITVSQIARRANISRSTFYDHYSDKYALLNALFDEVREQLTRITESRKTHPAENLPEDDLKKLRKYLIAEIRK